MAQAKVDKNVYQISSIIKRKAAENAKIQKDLRNFTRRVHRYWKRIAPVGDPTGARYEDNFGGPLPPHWKQRDDQAGSYKAGIVMRVRARKTKSGFPAYQVAATDDKSHWIEYGTGGDTPTPEFACRQRVVTRFSAMGNVEMGTSGVNEPWTKTMEGGWAKEGKRSQTAIPDKKEPRLKGGTKLTLTGTPEGKPARKGRGYDPIDNQRDNKYRRGAG